MLSPKDIGSKANASSIWSSDSGYETSRAVSPSLQAHAPNTTCSYPTHNHTPVIFNAGDIWGAPSECTRAREDSLVDPITTQLNVFTTNDTPDHSFVLPDLPAFDRSCLECEVWQLTNPGQRNKCQKCRAHSVHQSLPMTGNPSPTDKDALPRLDIPGNSHAKGLKRLRSIPRCSICEATLLVDSKYCPSCASDRLASSSTPSSPVHRVKRSRAGRNSKLPIAALNRLQAWLDANKHNPYPTADTKRWLAQECGITEKQVNTWFTNARARQMNTQQVESGSELDGTDDSEDPEAANLGLSGFIPDSTNLESSHRRTSAAARPSRRGKKKDYRRAHNVEVPQTPLLHSPASMTMSPLDHLLPSDQEMWQCTFCLKALVPKSWRRHEDTQHRPKTSAARWTCMLHGPRLSFPNRTNSGSVCAFCMAKNPTEEHFRQNHRIDECSKRDGADRTFYRPDHLRQHIKNFHNATLFEIVQARWKTAAEPVAEGWTCGFCGDRLETWDKRETHISNHFKEGMTMASWREYPDMDTQTNKKKGKGKAKEKEKASALTSSFMNIFRRPTPQQHQPPPQPQPSQLQAQSNAFVNAFQPLPIVSQVHTYQTTTPRCTSTGYESAYISSTAPLGLGISQPPVLPDIPNVSPLVVTQHDFDTVGNFVEWAPMPTFEQQMQYQLPNTNTFDSSVPTTTMQPDYTNLNAFGLGLYGNALDYQGSWAQQPSSSHDPQGPQQYTQYQRRQ